MTFNVGATQRRPKSKKLLSTLPISENRKEVEVQVPLENTSEIAPTLPKQAYDRLRAQGYNGGWFFAVHESGQHDIRVEHEGNYLSAAKLLLGVPEGASVGFLDGSCLNLHPSNLITVRTNNA